MKKIFHILCLCPLFLLSTGCMPFLRSVTHTDTSSAVFQALPPYAGPKARISLPDFEISAAKANNEIGKGLHSLLATTLVNSNRFYIVGPQGSNVPSGQVVSDLIVSTTLLEFEPQASGGRAGIGGGGGVASGILGGLLGTSLNKAHLVLEIRIIDTSASKIIANTRLKGQASDSSGINSATLLGAAALSGGLSSYNQTPMEKAIRLCIIEVVRYIAQNIPPAYYKHN